MGRTAELSNGKKIGNYLIERYLGSGNMGSVYVVKDLTSHTKHALKLLNIELPEESVGRFNREIQILKSLSHSNIVKYQGSGLFKGRPFYLMQLGDGASCTINIKAREYGVEIVNLEKRVIKIGTDITSALLYLSRKGIVHRDIKPENIISTNNGTHLLSDFGIAKLLQPKEDSFMTQEGLILGTPQYMAPENFNEQYSPKSDIYSFGITIYQIISGTLPFKGTIGEIIKKHGDTEIPETNEASSGLNSIIKECCQKKPKDRPNAKELIDMFKNVDREINKKNNQATTSIKVAS
ncbi:MAG: serine/threonine-protein kinase [Nanoarchaeota archaeon]|nr:serine/threonine-protein kinase [Nanoarchaeota archaeon]